MMTAERSCDPSDVPSLVRICANSFEEGEEAKEETFPSALFYVHPWITDSTSLMAYFIELFQEMNANKGMQLRICRAVAYWIRMCPSHFDSELCRLLGRLRSLALSAGIAQAESLLDTSSLKSYSWLRNMSLRKPVTRQISLSFEQWCAEDISTSLSHIDYKALYRIPISELKMYCNEGKLTHTPVLERSIAIFNSLSNWVQYMILSKPTAIERSHIIAKFVEVGKHLRKLNNFNTLMAVIGGVSHSNIARLSKTNSALPSHTKKELAKLTLLLSTQSNFANYRRALKETEGQFRIPIMYSASFVGVHLKDLIAWHCREGKENNFAMLSKRRIELLAYYLSYFVGFNRMQPNFGDPSPDLINTLKVSLDIRYNEEEIYKLSQKREARLLLRFTSASRPTVFAEWASGVSCALDQETVNKHITAMVDAVFKHYDHNKDGFISQSEFQQIAGNFPFIAPFGTIDTDRDGQITKDEMKSYFITVNKQSMEFRRGFKHNFVEASFISPTLCGHCEKILWGPIRHGYKCKDCGLGVHVNCKDMVVAECRRKSSKTLGWCGRNRLRTFSVQTTGEASRSTINNKSDQSSQKNKLRTRSDTNDCYRRESPTFPFTNAPLPSLASEEVFEDDSLGFPNSENSGNQQQLLQ